MDKARTKQLIDGAVKDFIDVCPHCDTKAHFQMLFNESYTEKNRDVIYYIIFRCVPCKKLILETYKFWQNQYDQNENLTSSGWQDKFPSDEIIFVNKFENIVPSEVLEDFKEGVISLQNKCYKASVSMFRRALQSAVINLGASTEEDLITQIKNLGNLTTEIKDWAHNIRIFGNWGAHPQDDNLKEVDLKLATETQSFLEEFFNYVYVMPSRVIKARQVGKPKEKPQEPGE
ncbi:MAG: DUF4145 domain-containing protein [Minisyncoccia bacterium]